MPEESGVVVKSLDKGGGLKWGPGTWKSEVSSETSLVGADDGVGVVETVAQEVAKSSEILKVLSGGGDELRQPADALVSVQTFNGPEEGVDVEIVVGSQSEAVQVEASGLEVVQSRTLGTFAVKPVASLVEGNVVFSVA